MTPGKPSVKILLMWLERLRSTLGKLSSASREREWQLMASQAVEIVEKAKSDILQAIQTGTVTEGELEWLSKDPTQEDLYKRVAVAGGEEAARISGGLTDAQILDLKRRAWVNVLGVIKEYNQRRNRI